MLLQETRQTCKEPEEQQAQQFPCSGSEGAPPPNSLRARLATLYAVHTCICISTNDFAACASERKRMRACKWHDQLQRTMRCTLPRTNPGAGELACWRRDWGELRIKTHARGGVRRLVIVARQSNYPVHQGKRVLARAAERKDAVLRLPRTSRAL